MSAWELSKRTLLYWGFHFSATLILPQSQPPRLGVLQIHRRSATDALHER